MRLCSKCQIVRFPHRFSKGQAWCKVCMTDYQLARRALLGTEGRRAEAARARLRRYGLDEQQYDALLLASGGRCSICSDEFVDTPSIDHCHESGVVRGLLCRRCNRALGLFKDSPAMLRAAADYLDS